MNINSYVSLLGEGTENLLLASLLNELGRNIAEVSTKEIRTEGASSLLFPELGVELVFRERQAFEKKFAQAKSAGFAVLVSVITYPNGSAGFERYVGAIPTADSSAVDRNGALASLGEPAISDSDDGTIRWDQWRRGELQLRVVYDKQLAIRRVSASVPMQKT